MRYVDLGKQTRFQDPLEVRPDGVLTIHYADGTCTHVSSMSGLEALGTVVDEPDWPEPLA